MKFFAAILIIISAIALIAIASLALIPVDITDADNGKTVSILRFRTIRLSLSSNPTTGSSWQLISPEDRRVLRLYYTKYRPSGTKLAGAGGIEERKFRAMAPGSTAVKLIYIRPWERVKLPAKSFAVEIRVR